MSAKLSLDLLHRWPNGEGRRGKLILVTATTPTTSGEGKTVTSISLAQGLERIGKRAIVTSREPSLGPVFGMKGGAAGGGRSQIEPAAKINLHFHGDFSRDHLGAQPALGAGGLAPVPRQTIWGWTPPR